MNSYTLAKPLLFRLDPEIAHDLTLKLAAALPQLVAPSKSQADLRLKCSVGKTEWNTPVGLAAGLDKNAVALEAFARLGFGAMECGTITPLPQIGNPKPRMFRYAEEASLRNAMGFPNLGMKACAQKLQHRPAGFPVAVNIGKSKAATAEEALQEYAELYLTLAPLSDWVVVNISSPNTPGLRDLQQVEWLQKLFHTLAPLKARHGKDIFVKLAPDMEDEQLKELTRTLADLGADGMVATNTTHIPERGVGGVSGRLLRVKGHQKRRAIIEVARDRGLPLVGVGGMEDMRDVMGWWAMGGGAFQVYTAFIYQGPELLRTIERETLAFLDRAKLPDLKTFLALVPSERQKLIASFGS
jgi:dihydroorotate dehydrogenase